jgi:hypothetical protein
LRAARRPLDLACQDINERRAGRKVRESMIGCGDDADRKLLARLHTPAAAATSMTQQIESRITVGKHELQANACARHVLELSP